MLKLVKGLQVIVIFALLTLISATLFSRTSHAIVVEPIIAIGILKLSIYFVGLLSIPITAFFQVIRGGDRKRVIIMSLTVLLGIFLLSFIAFSLFRGQVQKAPEKFQDSQSINAINEKINNGANKSTPSIDRIDPGFAEPGPTAPTIGRPVMDGLLYRVNPLDLAIKAFIVVFIVSSFALVVPLLIFLFILNRMGKRGWNALKFMLILFLSNTIISTIVAYTLTVFLLISQGFV